MQSHSQFSSSESISNQFVSSINHLPDSLPNLEQMANHKYVLPTSSNDLTDQLMSLPASTSQIHPVFIKSETSSSQIQSAFIKTESSDSQFESSPNWGNCSQCDTLFPGPHVLKVHVALHHNKNVNKLSDSNPSTSNSLKLKAQNSLTLQESQQSTDDSISGIIFDCTLKVYYFFLSALLWDFSLWLD